METVEMVVSIVAGSVGIAGAIYAFKKWILEWFRNRKPSRLFVKDGNIFLVYSSGDTKQVTFINSDSSAILGDSEVIFFRQLQNSTHDGYARFKLMSLKLATLAETVLADQKPFTDGAIGSFAIVSPRQLTFSLDQKKAMFVVEINLILV